MDQVNGADKWTIGQGNGFGRRSVVKSMVGQEDY